MTHDLLLLGIGAAAGVLLVSAAGAVRRRVRFEDRPAVLRRRILGRIRRQRVGVREALAAGGLTVRLHGYDHRVLLGAVDRSTMAAEVRSACRRRAAAAGWPVPPGWFVVDVRADPAVRRGRVLLEPGAPRGAADPDEEEATLPMVDGPTLATAPIESDDHP